MADVTSDGAEDRERLVLQILASFGHDPARLVREAPLERLDIDSLDFVELVQILEEDHGIKVRADAIRAAEPQTVGDVLDVICR